jgi:hypothetical protein
MKKILLLPIIAILSTGCAHVKLQPDITTGDIGFRASLTSSAVTTDSAALDVELSRLRYELRKDEVIADPEKRDLVLSKIVAVKREIEKRDLAEKKEKTFGDHVRLTFWDFSSGKEGMKSVLALAGGLAVSTYAIGIWSFDDFNGKSDADHQTRRIQADALKSSAEASQQRVEIDGSGNTVEVRDLPQDRTVRLEVSGQDNDVVIDLQQESF